MKFVKSNALRKISHRLIPGGAHTYSKGDDQFPAVSPGFIMRGKGCYVWDPDGNKFIDWGMGLRSTTLGHGYTPVVNAVIRQLRDGANYTRPSIWEPRLAQLLSKIIPCAEMVKFGKNGSTVTTAAVKLARAYTERDLVAVCGDQAFFSYDDWFIGSTVMNAGVPRAIRRLTVKFKFNDIEDLKKLFKEHPNKIACVILEPATEIEPKKGYLQELKKVCHRNGAVLIFDEMISGFRWHLRGAQYVYGVTPDMATFGKGVANGFSVSFLAGKRAIMSQGSIFGPQERVFLISTTHGAENHGLVAAIASIREMQKKPVIKHIYRVGTLLKKRLNAVALRHGLGDIVRVYGDRPCRLGASFAPASPYDPFTIKTYFFQELIQQGILFNGYFAPSYSHTEKEVRMTEKAWDNACKRLKTALDKKDLHKKLIGKPVKPVFRKYN